MANKIEDLIGEKAFSLMGAKNKIQGINGNFQWVINKNSKGIDAIRVSEESPDVFKVVFLKKKNGGLNGILTIGGVSSIGLIKVLQSGTGIYLS